MKKIFVLLLISVLVLNFVRPSAVALAQEEGGEEREGEAAPGGGNSVGQENPPGEEPPAGTIPEEGQEQPPPEGGITLSDEVKAALVAIAVGILVVGFVLLIKWGGI